MTTLHAVILGVVQGLSEFLPISSSAHLTLIPWLLNWRDPGQIYDTALHLGTLLAVVAVFWRDWIALIENGLTGKRVAETRLFWSLTVACIPGAIAGVFLDKYAQTIFRNPLAIATSITCCGFLLYIADVFGAKKNELESVNIGKGFLVGLFQALAIIPGVSRSGATMTSGLLLGLDRESAARFSFLLATPTVFGDGLLKLKDIVGMPGAFTASFFLGIFASAFTGFLVIKGLLSLIKRVSFKPFAYYRIILGLSVLVIWFARR